jgi:NDP-4-keto-2,6-dideoxyhexose 3-C-methyltransferase
MYKEVTACRVCGNKKLESILNLGVQALTGVFPRAASDPLTVGPLELMKCVGDDVCGLVQLRHSYTLSEMYGENYGYRSGLNPSMVAHLRSKVERINSFNILEKDDLVLDIGSNDGTTLSLYDREDLKLVGMDPTSEKFRQHYKPHIQAIADFFNAASFKAHFGNRKAKVITSFSMFYDLEDPVAFVREIAEILDPNGIWVLEQSYMPLMLDTNSYDTVCHEHLEYYALAQIDWIVRQCGMHIVDVEVNDVNGGSFSLTVQKDGGRLEVRDGVREMRAREAALGLDDLETYEAFKERVLEARTAFVDFLQTAKREGKTVVALGASTKGNVVLQYSGVTQDLISAVGEVNPDKFGAVTPGTHLPIRDEKDVLAENPDYAVVLPWHFRRFFENQQRYDHLNLVYPLPKLEIRPAK